MQDFPELFTPTKEWSPFFEGESNRRVGEASIVTNRDINVNVHGKRIDVYLFSVKANSLSRSHVQCRLCRRLVQVPGELFCHCFLCA